MVIPEKAVQAAHAAICEQSLDDCLDPDWRGKCVKAVEAAAPYLQAAALEEAADSAERQEIACVTPMALRRRAKSYRHTK